MPPLVIEVSREQARAARALLVEPPPFADYLAGCRVRSDDPDRPGYMPITPWPGQQRLAAELVAGGNLIVLKERQMGATTGAVAPYMRYCAEVRGWRVGYCSKDQLSARAQLRHIQELRPTGGDFNADEARFPSGGSIRVFPSTENAGVGDTFQLFVFDEAAEHPYFRVNHYKAGPAFARGQTVILSTSDPTMGAAGPYYEMWAAAEAGTGAYRPLFIGRYSRPDRDASFYVAEAVRLGAPVARAYYPESPEDAFAAPQGLVVASFSRAQHMVTPAIPWGEALYRIVGIDTSGGGDPTAIAAMGVWPRTEGPTQRLRADYELGRYHVYGYYCKKGAENASAQAIDAYFVPLEAEGHIDAIFASPEAGSLIATLQGMRWPVYPAPRGADERIAWIAAAFARGEMTMSPECVGFARQLETWWWQEPSESAAGGKRIGTRTPRSEHHADICDAVSYAGMGYLFAMPDVSGMGRVRRMAERHEVESKGPWYRGRRESVEPEGMLHRMGAR